MRLIVYHTVGYLFSKTIDRMKMSLRLYFFFLIFLLVSFQTYGQVTISGGTGGTLLCQGSPGYVTLSPIVITETGDGDFDLTSADSLRFDFSGAGFEFEPGFGTVVVSGAGVVNTSITVSASKIAILISEADNLNNGEINTLTISNLRVRSTVAGSVDIRRVATVNQAVLINGLPVGINIASLASFSTPTVDAGSSETGCQGAVFSFSSQVTPASVSSGTTLSWTHNGMGSLTNPSSLTPAYTPGASETGIVTFTLNATNTNTSCLSVSDVMQLTLIAPPAITLQPISQSLCEGSTLNLSVTATGTGLSYEWFQNGTTTGLTTASISIANATASNAGAYTVIVRGTCNPGGVTSTVASIVIYETPEVTLNPTNSTICETGNTSFTVNAGITSGAIIEWQESSNNGVSYTTISNGGIYSGATTSTLTLTSVPLTSNGYLYRARITGSCVGAEAFSTAATLTVQQSPVITVQPVSQSLCEGSTLNLSVTATGTGLSYEWFQNGTTTGLTTASISIANATALNAGAYTVIVRGTCNPGGVTSTVASIVIFEIPEVTLNPTNSTICETGNTSFTVNAGITSGAIIEWQESSNNGVSYTTISNGGIYSGATTSTLTLTSVPLTSNGYLYRARITGSCVGAEAFSTAATLTVQQSPVITVQPVSQSLCEGSTLNLSVTATGTGLSYEWLQNGTTTGLTTASISIANATASNAGAYTVIVRGTCNPGGVTSTVASIVIFETPEVTLNPTNSTICETGNTSFTVNAGITSGAIIEWQESSNNGVSYTTISNGGIYSGATTSTLTLTSVPLTSNGYLYRARITGSCVGAEAFSTAATLTVQQSPVITLQPVSQSLCEGSTLNLSVTATGTGLSYEWFQNGTTTGLTTASISIANATASNAGAYTVIVRGTCNPGGVTSTVANMVIFETPEVTVNPSDVTVCETGNTSFTVNAGITSGAIIEWQESSNNGVSYTTISNGGIYSGATTSTLTLTSVPLTSNGYLYRARITGSCVGAEAFSTAATLTVQQSPVITVQPVSQSLCEGSTLNLSVTATGTGLSYEWLQNGTTTGLTTASISIANATASNAGAYTVIVRGTCNPGGVTSTVASIVIFETPEVTLNPTNSTICETGNTSFTVNAGITSGTIIEWQESSNNGVSYTTISNGGIYSGATTSTLTLTSVPLTSNGYLYRARITGFCVGAEAFSTAATLTVQQSPVITLQPVSQSLCEGSTLNLSVTATGTGLSYEWFQNGTTTGLTTASISIANATASNAGAYTVIVRGTCNPGGVTSTVANMVIFETPEVTVNPSDVTVCETGNTSFTVNAGITSGAIIEWQESSNNGVSYTTISNGGIYSGATTSTLTLTSVPLTSNGYLYRARITGSCVGAEAFSTAATLTVQQSPVITVQPVSQSLCEGSTLNLSVTATGTGLSYEWLQNGTTTGLTTASISIANATASNAGAYTVIVRGTCNPGGVTSTVASIVIYETPEVTVNPSDVTVCETGNTSFTVNAGITSGAIIEWQESSNNGVSYTTISNGGIYSGATTSTLTLTSVPLTSNGYLYRARITGSCVGAEAFSTAATLTVQQSPVITLQPVSQSLCEGSTLNLSVTATGTGLSYEWFQNGTTTGLTTASISIANATASNAGAYTVIVRGTCNPGGVTSTVASIVIYETPEVTLNPTNSTICETGNTSFTVNAGITSGAIIEWQESSNNGVSYTTISNGGIYSGATTSTLTLTSVPLTSNGYLYRARITGSCVGAEAFSTAATLTVQQSPVITVQPVSQSLCEGSTLNLSVTATGTGLSYEWLQNGTTTGLTTASISIANATASNAGAYTVIVRGTCNPGGVTSTVASIVIYETPEVTVNPSDVTVCETGNTSFTVNAGITSGAIIEWQESSNNGVSYTTISNGGIYSGATTSTLTLTNVPLANNGFLYRARITGSCVGAEAFSTAATLTVQQSPVITLQPVSQSLCEGSTLNLSVTATGNGLSYEWFQNGTTTGLTTASISIANATASNAGAYTVIVRGTCNPGGVTSTVASIVIFETPEVTVNPSDVTVCETGNTSFTVNAGITSGAIIEWQESSNNGVSYTTISNGGVYSGATTSTLTLTNVPLTSDGYLYRARITGSCVGAEAFSSAATLTVQQSPVITLQPVSQSLCEGSTLNLSVTATGTGLSYEWFQNGTTTGLTTASISIANATASNAGAYTVIVRGTCNPGGVTSTVASIVIFETPEVTVNPSDVTVCETGNTSFTVNAGITSGAIIEWQESSNNGVSYTTISNGGIYSGATTSTLTLTSVPLTSNGYLYRARITGSCVGAEAFSTAATLTVQQSPVITVQPVSQSLCEGSTLNLSVTATGTGLSYEWFQNGTTTGLTTASISIANASASNAGAYTVIVRGTCNPGGVTSTVANMVIFETPEVTVNPSDVTVCETGNTSFTVNAGITSGAIIEWQLSTNGGGLYTTITNGGIYSGATTSTLTLTNVPLANNGFLYRARITGSCVGAEAFSTAATLTVQQSPVITLQPVSQSLCEGSTLNLSVTATGTGLSYEWLQNGTTTGLTTASISIANATASNAGAYTVIVRGTCNPGGVTSTVASMVIFETPEVTVNPSDVTVCETGNTSFTVNAGITSGAIIEWQESSNNGVSYSMISNGGIYSGATTSTLTLTSVPLTSNGYLYRARITGSCVGAEAFSTAATLTVQQSPVITLQPVSQSLCEGSTLNLSVTATGTGLSYEWFQNGTTTGLTTASISIANATASNAGAYTVIVRGTCNPGGVTSTVASIVIYETPEVTLNPTNSTICETGNTSFTVNAGITSGAIIEWQESSNNGVSYTTISNGGIYSGATTSTLTLTSVPLTSNSYLYRARITGSCVGAEAFSTAATLTVNQIPDAIASGQNICSGETTAISITNPNAVPGTIFSWTIQNSINAAGMIAGTGSSIAQTLSVVSNALPGSVTYRIVPAAAGCVGPVYTVTVNIQAVPDALASAETICSGTSTNVQITNPNAVPGTTFRWNVLTSSNVTGASAGIGNQISQLLTSTDGISSGTVTYRITPVANGCDGATIDVVVTVTPEPVIINNPSSLNNSICSGATLSFVPVSSVSGTTFSWTSAITGTINPGTVTPSGTGNITDSPVNTGNSTGTVIYTITPGNGTCSGDVVNYVVTVNPVPTAFAADESICSGATTNVTITNPNNVSGTIFQWTSAAVNVTGASNGTGNRISQSLTSTDAVTNGTVVYTITPYINDCPGVPYDVTVTVRPVPVMTNGPVTLAEQICSEATLNFVPASTIPSATLNWNTSFTGIDSGVTPSGSGVITDTPVNNNNVSGTITYRITPVLNSCFGAPVNYVVTVKPLPSATAPDFTVCSGTNASITISPAPKNVTGTTFSWTTAPNNVNGSSNGNGSGINQLLTTTTAFPGTVDYTITPFANGCVGQIEILTITVNPAATINAGNDFQVCVNDTIQFAGSFSGAAFATWTTNSTGSGTFSDINNPLAEYYLSASDKMGTTRTFTFTTDDPDGGGPCGPAIDQVIVLINKLPEVALTGLNPAYAENSGDVNLEGFPKTGGIGVYLGTGIIAGSNIFRPSAADIGLNVITYKFTNTATGCTNSVFKTTMINEITIIDFNIPDAVNNDLNEIHLCRESGDLWLQGSPGRYSPLASNSNYKFYEVVGGVEIEVPERIIQLIKPETGTLEFFLRTDGLVPNGIYELRYEFTNQQGASNSKPKALIVYSNPIASIDVDRVCVNENLNFLSSVTFEPDNSVPDNIISYDWTYGDGASQTVTNATSANHTYTSRGPKNVNLTAVSNNGCVHTTSRVVNVGEKPELKFEWENICNTNEPVLFSDRTVTTPSSEIETYKWSFGNGLPETTYGQPASTVTGVQNTAGTFKDPTHIYGTFGIFDVTMSVETVLGCSTSLTEKLYILKFDEIGINESYSVDFETVDESWITIPLEGNKENLPNSWDWGAVNGATINAAASGSNAWWTNKHVPADKQESLYYPNEESYVIGPCLDLSALDRPMISFDYWSDLERRNDGVVLQYSINGGDTWITLGDASGTGIEWYDARDLTSNPGGQDNFAWSGRAGGWRNARINLNEITDLSLVIFRFALASDGNTSKEDLPYDGFAIDNVVIKNKSRNVLVENFVNINDGSPGIQNHFNTLYEEQITNQGVTDFITVQYHIANPLPDDYNLSNPVDPFTRAQVYGVSVPNTSVMDGQFGKLFSQAAPSIPLDHISIDRQSLRDPLFEVTAVIDQNTDPSLPLTGSVTYKYIGTQPMTGIPVVLHAALVEDSLGSNINVLRKLLWEPQGVTINRTWNPGDTEAKDIRYEMRTPVENPEYLSVIAFVQNKVSRDVLQSAIFEAPAKEGVVVGIPEDPKVAGLNGLKVYPNPATSVINISLDKILQQDYHWKIIDQRGITVSHGNVKRDIRDGQEIDITRIPNGIYFMCIQTGEQSIFYRKIAIMNRN